jgi:excisionase family DNA binding protein
MKLEQPRIAVKINEAAARLGVHPATVRRLIARGLLKENRSLRTPLISVAALEKFVNK